MLAAILDGSSVSGRSGADEIDDRLAEEAGLVADGLVRYDDQTILDDLILRAELNEISMDLRTGAVTERNPPPAPLLSSSDEEESGGGDGGEVGGEESLGAGAGAGMEAAQGGLEATPAPWLDALVDRVRNLCIVCGEGTSFVLHVGGEGRLSQVLRPND